MVTVRTVAVAAMAGVLAWAALPATALAVVDPAATQASEAVAPIVVSTDADVVDPADGMVSLREAVDRANGRAGGDVIDLDGRTVALTLCAGGAENANRSGDLDHTDAGGALTLRHGAISGCGFDRVVDDRSPRGLVVRALTISGGEGGGRGGGVRSRGPVRVDRSQFLDNIANDTGGAIELTFTALAPGARSDVSTGRPRMARAWSANSLWFCDTSVTRPVSCLSLIHI